jgi:soluble lytic murein transglycosylase-like protein
MSTPPLLTSIKDRRDSILKNTPGTFHVNPDDTVRAYPSPRYARPEFEETTLNWLTIQQMARRYNLDPDFVSAIVWIESTHGWYDRYDPRNKTIRPMNVHARLWEQLGVTRRDLEDPQINIAAGVHILAAIWERTDEPTYEKVATLYNQLGASRVNGYGKTVVHYMVQKPWAPKIGESWRQYRHGRTPRLREWQNQ